MQWPSSTWGLRHDGWPDLYVAQRWRPPDKLDHRQSSSARSPMSRSRGSRTRPCSSWGSDLGDPQHRRNLWISVARHVAATPHEKTATMAATGAATDPRRKTGDQRTAVPAQRVYLAPARTGVWKRRFFRPRGLARRTGRGRCALRILRPRRGKSSCMGRNWHATGSHQRHGFDPRMTPGAEDFQR